MYSNLHKFGSTFITMNLTHVHLLINHLAVIGVALGIIVLLFAIVGKKTNTYYAAYTVLIISVVGAIIAYATGESAEETVEGIAGIAESAIEPHEESALLTIISFSILGVLSLASLIVGYVKINLQRTMGIIVLAMSLVSFTFVARTAWLGGKIRHTEISGTNNQIQPGVEKEHDD
jgi:uncharacterized membrane protein